MPRSQGTVPRHLLRGSDGLDDEWVEVAEDRIAALRQLWQTCLRIVVIESSPDIPSVIP